ncbi:hypothetical protein GW17_00019573 [Ensete ventricosum]|nr:hypothetical protein GW17_00019573 [Ensete ventricosum]
MPCGDGNLGRECVCLCERPRNPTVEPSPSSPWRRMPLVRLEVRNEYGLGDPELYRGAFRKEDPKAILDGVAVAGLVGILRQLGDLAE